MTELKTTITGANIFRRGAELIRRGSAELAAGTSNIKICGMSSAALIDSARLYSTEGVQCSNLRFETIFDDVEDPQVEALREKIDALRKRVEVKELQKQLWQANGDFSARTAQPVSEVADYIEGLAEKLEAIDLDILSSQKQIEKLEKQFEELSQKSELPIMIADVSVPAAGTYNFELKYFDYAAGWQSVYEIRSEGEGELEMITKAKITQNTYEDWSDIDVSLFTGSPVTAGNLPVLNPQYLNIHAPAMMRESVRAFGAAKMASRNAVEEAGMVYEEAADMAEPMVMMQMEAAETIEGETSTEYKLPGKKTIPKGEDGITADIQTTNIAAEYRIVSVPKLDKNAYLVAVIKPADLPVQSGISASVYYKGVYSGKTWLDPDPSREELDITLGTEERVNIVRKEASRNVSATLLKGQRIVELFYEITASNASSKPVELIVKDQVPVSQDKEINVEVLETFGDEYDKEKGLLTKKINLEPNQSEVLKFGFKVSYPKDKHIAGI